MHGDFSEVPEIKVCEICEGNNEKKEIPEDESGHLIITKRTVMHCAKIIYNVFLFSLATRKAFALSLFTVGFVICMICNHATMTTINYQADTIDSLARNEPNVMKTVIQMVAWVTVASVMRELYSLCFTLFINHTLHNISTALFYNTIYTISPISSVRINRIIDRGNRGIQNMLINILVKILYGVTSIIIIYKNLMEMDLRYVCVITGFNVIYLGVSFVLLKIRIRNKTLMNKYDDLYSNSIIECLANKESVVVNNTERQEIYTFDLHLTRFLQISFSDRVVVAALNVFQKFIYTLLHITLMVYVYMYGENKLNDAVKLMFYLKRLDRNLMNVAIATKTVFVRYVDCEIYIEYIHKLSKHMEPPVVQVSKSPLPSLNEAGQSNSQLEYKYNSTNQMDSENSTFHTNRTHTEEIPECPSAPGTKKAPKRKVAVEFKNVSYWPENSCKELIKDFSCRIFEGEKVCLIGKSGSGKTTLLSLLLKQKPYTGIIEVCGVDIREMTKDNITEKIGIVPQESALFNNTLMYNTEYGSAPNQANLSSILEDTAVNEIVESKKNGYDYTVGVAGRNLSGGEKQRVCLARCLLRDTGIIILDEATSKLDCLTENKIISSLCSQNRTVIIISHSPLIAELMERIIIINSENN
ncbi:ATP-binding cassette, subfamily B, heavy metal transporter [Nematocida parisii]|nr:ATP-binding cassette, subfamily B, heavy metal transporter [Nematocida parisii]